jgi:quercetin dioxygenase-like cupin family protein
MKYARIYADEHGESHLEDVEVAMSTSDFAPPAPPVELSAFMPSTSVGFLAFPPGWDGPPHPTPRRQFAIVLAGELEGGVSDGVTRRSGLGDVFLLEDTWGKGHTSRNVGNGYALLAIVQLPD